MQKVSKEEFIKKSALGGLIIVLPIAIVAMGIKWLFKLVTDLIQPFTNIVVNHIGFPELVGDIIVLVTMAGICFIVGYLVTTTGGAYLHTKFDGRLAQYAPGYRMVKDIINQFVGDKSNSPFANGEVALVKIFGEKADTQVTAIVTSRHTNGKFTVFVPTGPNPTSGNMYHVYESQVELRTDIKVEDMMRTIIACGAGSGELFSASERTNEVD